MVGNGNQIQDGAHWKSPEISNACSSHSCRRRRSTRKNVFGAWRQEKHHTDQLFVFKEMEESVLNMLYWGSVRIIE